MEKDSWKVLKAQVGWTKESVCQVCHCWKGQMFEAQEIPQM